MNGQALSDEQRRELLGFFADELQVCKTYFHLVREMLPLFNQGTDRQIGERYHTYWWFSFRATVRCLYLSLWAFFDNDSRVKRFSTLVNLTRDKALIKTYGNLKEEWKKQMQGFRHNYIAHLNGEIKRRDSTHSPTLSVPDINYLASKKLEDHIDELDELFIAVHKQITGSSEGWAPYIHAIEDFRSIKKRLVDS